MSALLGVVLLAGSSAAQGYDFESVITDLGSTEAAVRQNAVDRLAGIGVLALPAALDALQSADPAVRQGARIAVERITYDAAGTYHAPVAASHLMAAFTESGYEPWVRDLTMQMLSMVAGPGDVPALAELVDDRRLGEAAIYVLTRTGTEGAAEALAGALDDALAEDPEKAVALIDALGRMHVAPRASVRALDSDEESVVLAALLALPKAPDGDLAEPILAKVDSDNAAVAEAARNALIELGCTLMAADQTGAAAGVFAQALDAAANVQERCAALAGYSQAGGEGAEDLLWEAMASGEASLVGLASRQLVDYRLDSEEIADRIPAAFSPEREALIWLLGEIGDREAVVALREMAGHPDPMARQAVYQALKKNPDPRAAVDIVANLVSDDPAIRADGIAVINRTPGATVTEAIADTVQDPGIAVEVRTGLIDALGHRDPDDALSPLIWAAKTDDADMRTAALNALAALRAPEGIGGLLDLALTLPEEERPLAIAAIATVPREDARPVLLDLLKDATGSKAAAVLDVLAEYGDPKLRGVFAAAAKASDPEEAAAGVAGLVSVPGPGIMAVLTGYAADEREPIRTAAKQGLLALAESRDPQDEVSLGIYHQLLTDAASGIDEVKRALRGIAEVGSAESLDLVEPMLDDPGEAGNEVAAAMVAIAGDVALTDRDRAIRIYERILELSQDRATLTAAADALRTYGLSVNLAGPGGFVTGWWVTPPIAERAVMREENPLEITSAIDPMVPVSYDGEMYPWTFHHVDDPLGLLNLEQASARQDNVGCYALATVVSDQDRDIQLKIGSDDGIVVWVNGEKVHEVFVDRGWSVDQDVADAKLKEGPNQILCKVLQGGAQWSVSVRLTEDGEPLVLPQTQPVDVAASKGVVSAWWVTDKVGTQDELRDDDVIDTGAPVDTSEPVTVDGETVPWQYVQVDNLETGYLNLRRVLGDQEYLGIYGYVEFVPAEPGDAILSLGSDDDIYVWLNGDLVHRNNAARAAVPGDDTVDVQLEDGVNTLLVKVLQGNGDWGLVAQVLDADGGPLPIELQNLAE
jgi:HEAT repeat protein